MTHRGPAALLALLILALTAPFLFAPTAAAQGATTTIENAELRLWPEYDDPGLLVIFSGSFPAGVTYPVKLSVPVPAGARNIQATYQEGANTPINRPFEVTDGKLTYEIPSGGFHIEYYLDRSASGEQRQIPFAFTAPLPINALRVAVQQPARSTAFSLSPAEEKTEQGADGLTYHVFNRSNVAAGETLNIGINYAKSDNTLTSPQLAVTSTDAAPQANAPAVAPATTSPASWLPWVLIGLGVALLVGILVYWLLSRREPEPVAAARPSRSAGQTPTQPAKKPLPTVPARPVETARPAAPAAFCHNCGSPLKQEDRFCAQCGTPRRS